MHIVTSSLCNALLGQKVLNKLSIGKLRTKHDLPQCGMTNPYGENPGAVSILHGDDRGDRDHSELCSVKVSRSLPTVCRRLQRTLLGELAVLLSATKPRRDFVKFRTLGSLKSASTSST